MSQAPVVFLSHGGPNLAFSPQHPAHIQLKALGESIEQEPLTAIVAISAHWQGGKSFVDVNTGEDEPLIYDFYNFPSHYYQQEYHNVGDERLATRVLKLISDAGIDAKATHRGLDHGIWIPFLVAFPHLKVPIVTVSLFDNESSDLHYQLGAALAPLRKEGVAIIGGGMTVHNMSDYKNIRSGKAINTDYGKTFHANLRAVLDSDDRKGKVENLMSTSIARKAHPTFEHFMPMAVCLGAAGSDQANVLLDYIDPGTGDAMGYMCVEFKA